MTDDELSRLLDEYADAALTRRSIPIRFKAARAAIHAHFERRKSGEGGEDAARLDFLQAHANAIDARGSGASDDKWWIVIHHDGNWAEGETLRAAIDDARTEGKGNG